MVNGSREVSLDRYVMSTMAIRQDSRDGSLLLISDSSLGSALVANFSSISQVLCDELCSVKCSVQ